MRIYRAFMICMVTMVLCGCGRQDSSANKNLQTNNNNQVMIDPTQHPGAAATISALNFLKDLKDSGRLPGAIANGHGSIVPENWDKNVPEGTYPVSRTFYLKINNDSNQYCYNLMQASSNSSWKLQKAWCSDASGKVIEEYPLQ